MKGFYTLKGKLLKSKSQTLITGVYRSGTEYITHLINCHQAISATMYQVNIMRFAFKKGKNIHKEKIYKKILLDLKKRLNLRYKIKLDIKKICNHIKTKNIKVTYGKLYDLVMSHLYLRDFKKHWAEKNQLLWREIPDFIKIMPNGKAIIIIRDPRSILASFKKYTYAKKPLYLQAIFNCYDLFNFIKKNKKLIKNKKLYILKFENVLLNPKLEINKVFKFLNLKKIDNIKLNSNQLDAYGKKWKNNSSFEKNKNPNKFNKKLSLHRWKTSLNNAEILLTEMVCSDYMKYFKYKFKYSKIYKNILNDSLKLFINSDEIKKYLKFFLMEGKGIQKFPTNPLEQKNWSKD